MRYKITFSYDGSSFCGYQKQPSAPSVQEALETALGKLLRESHDFGFTGAGRTDSGVHAVNYVAHFDYPVEIPFTAADFIYKLNAILPFGVTIHSIESVSEDFHARFGAKRRTYRYFLHSSKDPFMAKYSYYLRYPLDFEAMNKAASQLLGTHDFSCFEKTGSDNGTSICTVFSAGWKEYTPSHVSELGFEGGKYYVFEISANRFLRNMVRATVGTLLEIGRGARKPEWILEVLASGDRCASGESVPGHALFLCKVEY